MIRLVLAQISHCGRRWLLHSVQRQRSVVRMAVLCAAAVWASASGAQGQGTGSGSAATRTYSTIPMHSSDHFVQGKYDKTGIYVPPHYEPVSKPPFHGYFFKKKLPDDKDHKNPKVPDPN